MVIFKAARASHGKPIDESAENDSCNLSHCLIATSTANARYLEDTS
jgi:hypothetical protein